MVEEGGFEGSSLGIELSRHRCKKNVTWEVFGGLFVKNLHHGVGGVLRAWRINESWLNVTIITYSYIARSQQQTYTR